MVSNKDDNEEDRLSYLLSGSSEVLPSSYIKLRSYLNIHSAKIAEKYGFNIFKSRNKVCPYCYSSWSCDTSSFKLLPSKKLKARIKKKANVEPHQKEPADELRNTLVLTCKVCLKKSSLSLVKKRKINKQVLKEEENVNRSKKKKKKKKKDKSCGLHVTVEKTATSSPQSFNFKKKTGLIPKETSQISLENTQKSSQKSQIKSPAKLPNSEKKSNSSKKPNKRLINNSFPSKAQNPFSKNKEKKLNELKKALKGGKDEVKKTLKDFLTLV